ncbi:aromatic ring-hydroxylating dioxygenase subunit alpha [Mesorhizobium sp. WSM3864]|uniref:aromatic ring-hydroxylating dioxygenase subunit alpha n=1 Tax=Mesorhizobium sp. WSM3864 TaxID=2029404 RepID=UPI001FE1805C|nr:aromatic ring-hydroxylating dioxygenase subunit alpha [Mesorhizobium sp. WSM3864]
MVCREADLAGPLAFRTARIGSQEVVVLRDETGSLRAFHNTCRHRGSQLCQESEGRLKARLLTCPYHAWTYSLRGDLVRIPSKSLPEGFDKDNYPLYRVALSVWRGFVFINLAVEPDGSAEASFDSASRDLSNWPLETLVPGHRLTKVMNCNWKIFWENFNECLHCPGVHKDLSRLVPIYGRGLIARHDDPEWARYADNDAPEFSGGLRAGAETWSRDGRVHGPVFADLTPAERAAGQTYATSLPSMFIVGHVDYVRTVRLTPLGPEQTELTAEWLFAPDALAQTDIDNIVAFGTQVLEEDAAICEVNQKGLHSIRHQAGVLMPEEYDLRRFHEWVRGRHAALQPVKTTSADSAK